MKKKFTIVLSMMMLAGLAWDQQFHSAHTNPNQAPAGNTGSPGDNGNTCARSGCHSGPAHTTESVAMTSNIPSTGYVPGTTYSMTVNLTGNAVGNRFGLSISPQTQQGGLLGTLIASMSGTALNGGNKYLTQTSSGTFGSGGAKTYTFQWTAPATGLGPVTFYGAFNFANGNGNDNGDVIVSDSFTFEESSVGISENTVDGILIYPNPVTDEIHINARDVDEEIFVRLYSIDGRKVLDNRYDSGQINMDFRGKSLTTGVYFLELESNGNQTVRKIMVK